MPCCTNCGTEVGFCPKCGHNLGIDESKKRSFRRIVVWFAVLLCYLFYICAMESQNLKLFALAIFPAILLLDKPFIVLRNVSIVGLVVSIIFLIVSYTKTNSGDYEYESWAGINGIGLRWIIVSIYIGLVLFTQYCVNIFNQAKKIHKP